MSIFNNKRGRVFGRGVLGGGGIQGPLQAFVNFFQNTPEFYAPTASLAITVLEQIAIDYSPDILLDFNQEAGHGAVIPDISGNSRDFTADGVEDTDFFWHPGEGHLVDTPGRLALTGGAKWFADAAFSGDHSWVFGAKCDMTGTAGYPFDIGATRFLLRGATGLTGYAGASSDTTAYDAGLDNEYLYSVVRSDTDLGLYVNGLKVWSSPTVALSFDSGTEWAIAQRVGTGGNTASGDYDGAWLYKNAALTDADIYDIYERMSGGQLHDYKERIAGTSLETGIVQALPLWEVDGTSGDVMDVSGQENHAGYIGGVTLGEAAISPDFLYSARAASGQGVNTKVGAGLDLTTDSLTVSMDANFVTQTSRIFWQLGLYGGAAENVLRLVELSGTYRALLYDAGGAIIAQSNVAAISSATGTRWRFTCTWDHATKELTLWVDDTKGPVAVATGTVPATNGDERLGGTVTAFFCGFRKWNRVLSDTEVLALNA